MALVKCNECGRMISDRARSCVGCGAPLARSDGFFRAEPEPSSAPPPSPRRSLAMLGGGAIALAVGLILAGLFEHRAGSPVETIAALLIIAGLCTLIVSALQLEAARRRRG